jgi:hypothetical protein
LQYGRYANALEAAEKVKKFKTAELLIKLGAEGKVVEDEDNDELNAHDEWVSYESSSDDEWDSDVESETWESMQQRKWNVEKFDRIIPHLNLEQQLFHRTLLLVSLNPVSM